MAVTFLVAFFLKVFLAILNVVAFLVTVGVAAGAVVVCFANETVAVNEFP